jgi:cardiolipin synthase
MTLVYIALAIIWLAILVRAVLRPHRQPASRVAWVLVIVLLPGMGILFYILLGGGN